MKRAPTTTAIGNLDSPWEATVDAHGAVAPWLVRWSLDWWVQAGDDGAWLRPADAGTALTQRRIDAAPVVETSRRVPGGHAVHRAWCVRAEEAEWVLVEVENRSRHPIAVALVVAPAKRIAFDETTNVAIADRRPALVLARHPSRFIVDDDTAEWPGTVRSWRGRAEAAFVHPLAHTATLRAALPLVAQRRLPAFDVAAAPPAERVANGWRAHVDAGMRVEPLADAVRAALADALVRHDNPDLPRAEATRLRTGLGLWGLGPFTARTNDDGGEPLVAARDRLVREAGDRDAPELVLGWDSPGQSIEVHGAPTEWGVLSYGVRWHGARPAVLWQLEPRRDLRVRVTLRMPALDPTWSSTEPRGEALLAPVGLPKVVAPLPDGTPVDDAGDPGVSFS